MKYFEKIRYKPGSVGFSPETMRMIEILKQEFGESRSRIISRAIDLLYRDYQVECGVKPDGKVD